LIAVPKHLSAQFFISSMVTKTGEVAEIEETIPATQIQSSVMKTLEAKSKGLKITKAEKVTHGSDYNYELVIEIKASWHEMKLENF
jgi:hypothetical protein